MMKILQVLPALNAGGVERTTIEVAEALKAGGHEAYVACAGGRMEEQLAAVGGHLHKIKIGSKNPLKLRAHTKALIDIIRTQKIDLVHARSRAPAWPAHAAARATNRPFVTTYHGIYNARSKMKRRYNAIMARGDVVIANSEFTKAHIIREHGTDPNKIVVIPRGVDMALFDPATISDDHIAEQRQAWKILPSQKAILLPGRLTRWKGQDIAIKALSKLDDNHILILLGDPQGRDKYVAEINNLARSLKVSERLRVPGHTQDVAMALASSDIVISASTEPEAFGRVMAEAQAMGRPVVATSHGGALETVLNGTTGLLVPPSNPQALADAIQSVLNWNTFDPAAARQRIGDQFSKKQLQNRTLGVYQQLLL